MRVKKTYLPKLLLVVLLFAGGIFSCERSEPIPGQNDISENSRPLEQKMILKKEDTQSFFFITYHLDSMETAASVDSFRQKYSAPEQEFIFALNRMDPHRLTVGGKLVIPDTFTTNFLDYSPFPDYFEMLNSIPKSVLISRRIQGFALYEYGRLVRWGPISSGKSSTPTPVGLFYGNYKALRKISTVNESWIMPYYFNYMNFEGVGVHQYAMPGYPASHACVRLKKEDAEVIYNWANQWKLDPTGQIIERNGTPFMVYGDYDFASHAPWLDLADNPNSNFLTAEEMEVLKDYTIQYEKDERNFDLPALSPELLNIPTKESLEKVN